MNSALELDNVTKRFGRICAVDELSLKVEPGVMAGFLGPNGAGKSTTLFMIQRIVRPSAGRIRLFGKDISQDYKAAIQPVGVAVETPAFYDYLSGRLNLELAARLRGLVSSDEIDRLLKRVGMANRQDDLVRTYSTGMRQRLAIARAMLGNPKLLVLDEPTNGLDPESTEEILAFLRDKVKNDGLTIFISSHLMSEIEEFCDTVFLINKGRLVASGKVREILAPREATLRVTFAGPMPPAAFLARHEQVRNVEIVNSDTMDITLARTDAAAWLNHMLVQEGFRISVLAPKRKTLKEFFLSITGNKPHA